MNIVCLFLGLGTRKNYLRCINCLLDFHGFDHILINIQYYNITHPYELTCAKNAKYICFSCFGGHVKSSKNNREQQ